jgi:hypothetical protein
MSRLLVPIELDVLMVRQAGGRFADASMAEPTTDDVAHRTLWKPAFTELPQGRARGAYLHWALPDALTHGSADETGALSFHAIPDRWLVVRSAPSPLVNRRAVRGWVLEADRGVATPVNTWRETARPAVGHEPLTSLGHGDFAWAAYFDNTRNRLAFYDDLADVTSGPISYLVCGWYAQGERDPIADPSLDTSVGVNARLREYRWKMAVTKAGGNAPRASLYHGSAVGIGWPAPDAASPETGGPPASAGIRVVLASTTAEALATLVARSDGEVRVLEAAQLGVLDELAESDGRARLDAVLHAAAFGSISGGEVLERVDQPEPEPGPDTGPMPPRPGGLDVAVTTAGLEMATRSFRMADRASEARITAGRVEDLLAARPAPEAPEAPPAAAGPVEVYRALPRFFHPADPVVLVEGAHRSFKHGGDGRFSTEGMLVCRTTGDTITELAVLDPRDSGGQRLAIRGSTVFQGGIANPDIPPECLELLAELALLDPGSSPVLTQALAPGRTPTPVTASLRRRIEVEQTAWWAMRDTRVDPSGLVTLSGLTGTLPSPIAVTPARRPWTPVHLEWRVEYGHAPRAPRGWRLGDVDFEPETPEPDAPLVLEGRTLVTPAAAHLAGSAARRAYRQALRIGGSSPVDPSVPRRFTSDLSAALDARLGTLTVRGDDGNLDVATALADMDVLSGTLDPLHEEIGKRFALRVGTLTLTRLRLVDGFGQFIDLVGESGSASVTVAETLRDEATQGVLLPPRIVTPARLWLRYADGSGGEALASADVSPVAGYLLPNHLDGSLEIFDADGTSRGALRSSDDGGVVFEAAPGIATRLGARPADAIGNPALAAIAEGLIDWGVADAKRRASDGAFEGGLSALIRLIDAGRWSSDPQANGANDDLGPLVGRPIAVLRARAWLELAEPDPRLERTEFPLRLGSVASFEDGLLGAFAGGDYRTLLVPGAVAGLAREIGPGRGYLQQAPAVSAFHSGFASDVGGAGDGGAPVRHAYVARDRAVPLTPGRPVELTLLVEPYGLVHATTGTLPRKEIGMRREWLAAGLARIAPTFRFGPVLVDPARVRLPLGREVAGTWSWAHRVDEATWSEEPVVDAANETAAIGETVRAMEGWLRFTPEDEA